MSWTLFEAAAGAYEDWYGTRRGQRADRAERRLLAWMLGGVPGVRTVLEIGCATGHFARALAASGLRTVGLDRSPAMLAEARQRCAGVTFVLGDAHRLPVRTAAVDVALFVTTLEFLGDQQAAAAEAVRVARRGVLVVALNRWSIGGLSRRCGPQARRPLLGRARDYSVVSLRTTLAAAAGERLRAIRWASTLFPDGAWKVQAPLPLGDIIGVAALLTAPSAAVSAVSPNVRR